MTETTNILITGANRGIGKSVLATFLARPNHILVAAVRDPGHATSKTLDELPKAAGSKLIIVKIDSGSETDALEAVKALKSQHGISKLDIVIANAGISNDYGSVREVAVDSLYEHIKVNTFGPLLLFQATADLLTAAPKPQFVAVSSLVGSIAAQNDFEALPTTIYGTSKAALNFVVQRIHLENPHIIAYPISPGWLQTEMGNAGAVASGMAEAPTTLKEGVDGIVKRIDGATRENISGKFPNYDGKFFSW